MTEAIYRKRGRRYVEVGWYDPQATYYPHGAHLVVSEPGRTLTLYRIDPDHAALLAARKMTLGSFLVGGQQTIS